MGKVILLLCVVLFITEITQAAILTFDNIGTDSSALIPNGYGGFDWYRTGEGFYYYNVQIADPDSGFANSVVSGDYVAFPTTYEPAGIGGVDSINPFTFIGAYFTAAWRDGLNIQVDGFLEDGLVYSTIITVDTTGPTWINFNYIGIDNLRFAAFGGIVHEGYQYDNTQFAIDNFTFVPEPATLLLLGLGAFGVRGLNV